MPLLMRAGSCISPALALPMASTIPLSDDITAAYLPLAVQPANDIARQAYDEAVSTLQKDLKGDANGLNVIFSANSAENILQIVSHLEGEYNRHGYKRKKVLYCLHSFSARVAHYERILDTLAQHHPEYVSLAWGTLKLVFTGIINHHELVEKLAQALTDIGSILAQVRLTAELYQTDHMKQAVASLYAYILKFLVSVIPWYKHRSATRLLLSIVSPFDVVYRDTLQQIKNAADTITALANHANWAELRDVHGVVRDVRGDVDEIDLRLQRLEYGVQQISRYTMSCEQKIDHVLKVGIATKSLVERSPVGFRDVYCFQQEILVQLSLSIDPEANLHKQQVLSKNRQRKPGYVFDVGSVMAALNRWGSSPGSSLLVLQSGSRANAAAKSLAVELISHIQSQSRKTLYTLSQPRSVNHTPSIENILRLLVCQAIRRHSNILYDLHDGFNFNKLKSDHSEKDWLDLLCKILCKIGNSFVVIESEDLYRLHGGDPKWQLQFLSAFKQITESAQASGVTVKTLVLNFGVPDSRLVDELEGSPHGYATVHRASPLPPRLKRTAAARSEKQRRSLKSLQMKS